MAPEAGLDDKSRREELYLQSVLGALRDREAQYDTTLEQDEDVIARTRVEGRLAMAVIVRRGEKIAAQGGTVLDPEKDRTAARTRSGERRTSTKTAEDESVAHELETRRRFHRTRRVYFHRPKLT